MDLSSRLSSLSVLLLALVAILEALALLCGTYAVPYALTYSGSSQAMDVANAEFKSALEAVREAEVAGADRKHVAVLVERLNSVIGMIDEAESLRLQGNVEEADAVAVQSTGVSRQIVSEAIQLRYEASLSTYNERILTFGMVPVASLLVTVGAHYGWKWWRRREVDRLMRMEIKRVKEPEEE